MIWRVATILFELAALAVVFAVMRWTNRRIDEQLAGATLAPEDTRKARTGAAAQESPLDGSTTPARAPLASPPQAQAGTRAPVFCYGCHQIHEPPLHPPRWPVALYFPHASGFVAHQFEVEGQLAAAHVALYRVPRFGNEARA